ncbi:MAG TPA: hypothetical protein DIV86_06145 [Alphaproteobacteria bacterium]|nr:hypothetical protein [Alphaproteobacteria bacterium]
MSSLDNLWQVCNGQNNFNKFSIALFDQHFLDFYFSPAWSIEKIKRALALNLSENNPNNNCWKIYSLTIREFDFTNYVNSCNRDQHGKLDLKNDEQIVAFYDSLNKVFRVYDFVNKRAVIIIQEDYIFNEWELHSPLREFFHIWALKNNALLIHSGIVSKNGVAILLPGAGGSGKSTTTISCLQHNLQTTGDDYNLIFKTEASFKVCTLYSNVKLKNPKPQRKSFDFPIMQGWESENLEYAEKTIFYPPLNSTIWDKSNPKLTGILCPYIASPQPVQPEIITMKSVELINRLAVSSIMQSPFMAKEYLAMSVALAKQMKIAYLHLSTDIKANVECIEEWL